MPSPAISDEVLQKAVDTAAQYPSTVAAAKAMGIARSTLQSQLSTAAKRGIKAGNLNHNAFDNLVARSVPSKKTTSLGKSLTEFRAQYDKSYLVPMAIEEGLKNLGDDAWEYEAAFIKICGLSQTDFGRFREEFAEYYVVVDGTRSGKRIWAGSKNLAAQLRRLV